MVSYNVVYISLSYTYSYSQKLEGRTWIDGLNIDDGYGELLGSSSNDEGTNAYR